MEKTYEPKQHKIRVRLYHNYLPQVEGKYIARTINEAFLKVRDIAASAKTRGGFTGSFEDMIEYVNLFLWEVIYQVSDGFAVDLEYFTLQPNVGGTFDKATEGQDDERHPISIRFRPKAKMKKITDEIEVIVEGLGGNNGFIDEFIDVEEEATNSICVPGDMIIIRGDRIKVAGNDSTVGVYLRSEDDPAQEVKMTRIAENTSTKIIGICPTTGFSRSRVVIKTQFSGSTKHLKNVRSIVSDFVIEEA